MENVVLHFGAPGNTRGERYGIQSGNKSTKSRTSRKSLSFDNENGHFWRLLYSSDVHHKGPLYMKGSVSCAIKHLSVYHAYLHAIQLTE